MLKFRAIAYNPNLISSFLWNSHQCIKKEIQALSINHSSCNQKNAFFISTLFFASIFNIIYIYRNLSHWLVTYIVILHSIFPFLSSSLNSSGLNPLSKTNSYGQFSSAPPPRGILESLYLQT